jgi:hypothetical protein
MSAADYAALVAAIDDYTCLYDSDAEVTGIYDPDPAVQRSLYLEELGVRRDFVFVNIHGSATSQWIAGGVSVDSEDIAAARPQALFTVLASCSNGDFTASDYLAGWQLFGGRGLVVLANTTVAMLVGGGSVEFLYDTIPLGLGVTFGDMYLHDRSWLLTHLFGDPTLTMRPFPAGDAPVLNVAPLAVPFGDVPLGATATLNVAFSNTGTTPATVQLKKAPFSIDGAWVNLGYWDVFYYTHPYTGQTFGPLVIPAGQAMAVPFTFYPRADAPEGHYSMRMRFQTNVPTCPYVDIALTGSAWASARP